MESILRKYTGDILPVTLYVAMNCSLAELQAYMRQVHKEPAELEKLTTNTDACCYLYPEKGSAILFVPKSDSAKASIIAHEAVHIANHYMLYLQLVQEDNDEIMAYLVEWIVEKALLIPPSTPGPIGNWVKANNGLWDRNFDMAGKLVKLRGLKGDYRIDCKVESTKLYIKYRLGESSGYLSVFQNISSEVLRTDNDIMAYLEAEKKDE